jgi:hypothetical protein
MNPSPLRFVHCELAQARGDRPGESIVIFLPCSRAPAASSRRVRHRTCTARLTFLASTRAAHALLIIAHRIHAEWSTRITELTRHAVHHFITSFVMVGARHNAQVQLRASS